MFLIYCKSLINLNINREKMEAQLEKENRMLQLNTSGHSYNHGNGSNRDVYKKYTNSSTQTEHRINFTKYIFIRVKYLFIYLFI